MNTHSLPFVLLCTMLLLTGCDVAKQGDVSQHNQLETPALPFIQDAVFSLSPRFNGQRNPAVMAQVCALAGGETSQEEVNKVLAKQGVDHARLPHAGDPIALLVNGDRAAQATACAAFLATEPMSPIDINALRPNVASTSAAQEKTPPQQFDPVRLAQVLPIKIAEARTNAEIFARIAKHLEKQPGLTANEYRQQASQHFAHLAPTYLQRLQQLIPPANTTYHLTQLDNDGVAFDTSHEQRFEYGADGLLFHQHGILWYGAGKLLGKDYPLHVKYSSSEMTR